MHKSKPRQVNHILALWCVYFVGLLFLLIVIISIDKYCRAIKTFLYQTMTNDIIFQYNKEINVGNCHNMYTSHIHVYMYTSHIHQYTSYIPISLIPICGMESELPFLQPILLIHVTGTNISYAVCTKYIFSLLCPLSIYTFFS